MASRITAHVARRTDPHRPPASRRISRPVVVETQSAGRRDQRLGAPEVRASLFGDATCARCVVAPATCDCTSRAWRTKRRSQAEGRATLLLAVSSYSFTDEPPEPQGSVRPRRIARLPARQSWHRSASSAAELAVLSTSRAKVGGGSIERSRTPSCRESGPRRRRGRSPSSGSLPAPCERPPALLAEGRRPDGHVSGFGTLGPPTITTIRIPRESMVVRR